MGAAQFFTVSMGRNPHHAFDRAVEGARHQHGHGGYTGTIAEKDSFKMMGSVGTAHWRKVPGWLERELVSRDGHVGTTRLPGTPIPEKYRVMVRQFADLYNDKWGPAIGYQVTGDAAIQLRVEAGRKGKHEQVYVFCGLASE